MSRIATHIITSEKQRDTAIASLLRAIGDPGASPDTYTGKTLLRLLDESRGTPFGFKKIQKQGYNSFTLAAGQSWGVILTETSPSVETLLYCEFNIDANNTTGKYEYDVDQLFGIEIDDDMKVQIDFNTMSFIKTLSDSTGAASFASQLPAGIPWRHDAAKACSAFVLGLFVPASATVKFYARNADTENTALIRIPRYYAEML